MIVQSWREVNSFRASIGAAFAGPYFDVKAPRIFRREGLVSVSLQSPFQQSVSGNRERIPGVDGLRAIAALIVIANHWYFNYYRQQEGPIGIIGVTIFFVISGYLITGILLRTRESGDGLSRNIITFYVKRSIRIIPIYYITITVGILAGLACFVQVSPAWYYFYVCNFRPLFGLFDFGAAGHFWSLAVEEQFYLVWPLLMLVVPRAALLPVILGLIVFSPVTICLELMANWHIGAIYMFPLSHCSALGAGALLAFVHERAKDEAIPASRPLLEIALCALVIVAVFDYRTGTAGFASMISATTMFLVILMSVCCIDSFRRGRGGIWTRALNVKPMVYLGQISYGLYVFHNFMPSLFIGTKYTPFGKPHSTNLLVYTVALLLVSTASWHLIEQPLNKRRNQAAEAAINVFARLKSRRRAPAGGA
jgi:peptidoglycan/LPS O-acetylase OafA/YrhL